MADIPHVWEMRAQFIKVLRRGEGADKKVRIFYRVTPGTGNFGPHTYIHAKTWIFDDELAVIGSANCNERGWTSDSEVIAAIFDIPPSTSTAKFSFAQQLRMELWAEHLGVKPLEVAHGIEKANLWLDAANKPASGVRLYKPEEGKDKGVTTNADWYTQVDPSAQSLPSCGDSSTISQ